MRGQTKRHLPPINWTPCSSPTPAPNAKWRANCPTAGSTPSTESGSTTADPPSSNSPSAGSASARAASDSASARAPSLRCPKRRAVCPRHRPTSPSRGLPGTARVPTCTHQRSKSSRSSSLDALPARATAAPSGPSHTHAFPALECQRLRSSTSASPSPPSHPTSATSSPTSAPEIASKPWSSHRDVPTPVTIRWPGIRTTHLRRTAPGHRYRTSEAAGRGSAADSGTFP